jgi:hypothetical protein
MRLNFEDELGKRHFEFLFVGFILGGSMQDKKGLSTLRRELVLFEKLEAISEPMPCGKKLHNGETQRQLVNGGALEVTPDELDMLYNYMTATPWQTGTPTKQALETIDWLHANGHNS